MKQRSFVRTRHFTPVARFTRAWIETTNVPSAYRLARSPASRGRGLKLDYRHTRHLHARSPASRGRGLKQRNLAQLNRASRSPASRGRGLKPRELWPSDYLRWVARFTRAWIETSLFPRLVQFHMSPASRGRGLKLTRLDRAGYQTTSPASRGRGLKRRVRAYSIRHRGRPLHAGVD